MKNEMNKVRFLLLWLIFKLHSKYLLLNSADFFSRYKV